MSVRKYLLFIIVNSPLLIYAQINDSLKIICDSIQVKQDSTCWSCDALIRSKDYDIKVIDDSICINISSIDSLKFSKSQDVYTSIDEYKLSINDIDRIEYIIVPKKLYELEWSESYIEFTALRFQPLFKHRNNTKKFEEASVRLLLTNQKDSTHFKHLYRLLKDNIDVSQNHLLASCARDKFHEWSGKEIDAISITDLEVPINLNGEACTEKGIEKLLLKYLVDQNIKGVLGYLVIDENNQMELIWTEQNKLYKQLNDDNQSYPGIKTMVENIGLISDKQIKDIIQLLEKQNWKSRQCENKNERSYIDIFIKNEKFQVLGQNK